jgi:hypothetical protein
MEKDIEEQIYKTIEEDKKILRLLRRSRSEIDAVISSMEKVMNAHAETAAFLNRSE